MPEPIKVAADTIREGDTVVTPDGEHFQVIDVEFFRRAWLDDLARVRITARSGDTTVSEKYLIEEELSVIRCPHDEGTTKKMRATLCTRCNLVLKQR